MAKRPSLKVTAPKFGKWLEGKRKAGNGLTHEQLAMKIRPFVERAGLKVKPSLLVNYEQGRVPNWPMFMALASVYKIPILEMTVRLIDALEFPGRDLVRHGGTPPSDLSLEVGGESAETRVRELLDRAEKAEEERDYYRRIIELVGQHVSAAGDVLRQAIPPTPSNKATRRRAG